jgi:nicotinamidase-related amidase
MLHDMNKDNLTENLMKDYQPDFITVINSILLIVDFQSKMIGRIGSGDKEEMVSAVVASAKAASILNVPVILTAINEEENGETIHEVTDIFPVKEIFRRNPECYDAFEDEKVLKAIRQFGREKMVISGLFTNQSFAETAIRAARERYDVFGLIDACGDISPESHNAGVQRMLKAGITPITWMSLTSEWMNGWLDPSGGEASVEYFGKYNAMLSYLSRH